MIKDIKIWLLIIIYNKKKDFKFIKKAIKDKYKNYHLKLLFKKNFSFTLRI